MRIIRVRVQDLFGVFDHDIPLHVDDRMTIIHGPNGFGKTTLLQMLHGIFGRRYVELRNVRFQRFEITFEEDGVLWAEKAGDGSDPAEVRICYRRPDRSRANCFLLGSRATPDPRRGHIPRHMLEEYVEGLTRVGYSKWAHGPSAEILSLDAVIDRFAHLLPVEWLDVMGVEEEPDWWVELQDSVEIRFITAQRLFNIRETGTRGRRQQMVPAVTEYSDELAEIIQQKLAESADLSQALDRTFPSRLVQQMGQSELSGEELRDKLRDLEKRRSGLKDAGLLGKQEDMDFLPAEGSIEHARDVLAVYVQDVEEKLGVFDEISRKLELLTRIVNSRFQYKRFSISKERGFTFTASDGSPLPLTKLSSGEQHELVLLFELLFKVHPDSLILIDEPELSLHVAWQKQFLKDLEEITRIASFDVLVATHSPQIIHDRWDLAVELKGPSVS